MHLSAAWAFSVNKTIDWWSDSLVGDLRRRGVILTILMSPVWVFPFSSSEIIVAWSWVRSISVLDTPCMTMPYFGLWTLMPSNALFQSTSRSCLTSSSLWHCSLMLPLVSLLIPLIYGLLVRLDSLIALRHRSVMSLACMVLVCCWILGLAVSVVRVSSYLALSCRNISRFWCFRLHVSCFVWVFIDGDAVLATSIQDLTDWIAALISLRSFPRLFGCWVEGNFSILP